MILRTAFACVVFVASLELTAGKGLAVVKRARIGVVMCLTSKNTKTMPLAEMAVSQLMMPSFGRTAETDLFEYRLYFGIDDDDPVWTLPIAVAYLELIGKNAGAQRVVVRFVRNRANHIPMNEILKVAYDDNCEYIARINDDTEFASTGWTSLGVAALAAFDPPNVGVVGPTCREGNLAILTHDMTHRTHLDIFKGVYYADEFDNWWLDDWISKVYGPKRTRKLETWIVKHHVGFYGTRYEVAHRKQRVLAREISRGRQTINKWLRASSECYPGRQCRRIIAYSLYGSDARYTRGAIENADHARVVYPTWEMRVYYDNTVPASVIQTLRDDKNVALVDMSGSSIENKMAWRFLAASDRSMEHACFRDIDSRLSAREKAAVDEWVRSEKQFHVMRDHPSHSNFAMSGGMWCVARGGFPQMESILKSSQIGTGYIDDMHFLTKTVWPIAQRNVLQHDAFGCRSNQWGNSSPFPTKRMGLEHVGSVFLNGQMRRGDVKILKAGLNKECVPRPVIITEDGLQDEVCNFHFHTRRAHGLNNGNQIKKPSIVCAMGETSALRLFFATIAPQIQVPFVLVTMEHDDGVPPDRDTLSHPWLLSWYGWNVKASHPKLHALPIGLNRRTQLKRVEEQRKLHTAKNGRLLVNFKLDRDERRKLWQYKTAWAAFADFVDYPSSNYHKLVASYSYVLCPQGLGTDTHRTWEALYLGAVPIVLKSTISSVYDGLPVVQLDRWEDLTLARLSSVSFYASERLDLAWWTTQIKGTLNQNSLRKHAHTIIQPDVIDVLPMSDLIVHGEWDFINALVTTTCNSDGVRSCNSTQILNVKPCICRWIQTDYKMVCPSVLLLENGENFGMMDPAPILNYPNSGTSYQGCSGSWEQDSVKFSHFLDQDNVIRILYRQTPPITHVKIDLVPLGPSRQFVAAWGKLAPNPQINRSKLFYVNHSPWRHRKQIFKTVNQNFNGLLRNEYCEPVYGCTGGQMSVADYAMKLRSSLFVESPPGMGEDCFRHYEIMIAGAVPVVRKSLSYGVFGNLPHLPVTNWNEVTPQLLRTSRIKPKTLERLRKSFWLNRIKSLAANRNRDALVGYATGYSFSDVYRQLHAFSAVTTVGQYFVLFVTLDTSEKQSLVKLFPRCILLHPDAILKAGDSYMGVTFSKQGNPAFTRFLVLGKWAKVNQHVYNKIIVSDIRDIGIFADPFEQIDTLRPEVQIFTEVVTYGYDRWYNQPWVRDCYGQTFLNEIMKTKVTCVGLIAGTASDIVKYLHAWIAEYKIKGMCHTVGADTAIHAWITNRVLKNARIVDSETALIRHAPKWGADAQEQLRTDASIKYDDANRMLNANGNAYAIIHQLDRFGDLWKPYCDNHSQPSNAKLSICVGVLAFQGIRTLQNTLDTYSRPGGLFDSVAAIHILFQSIDTPARTKWARGVVAEYPRLQPMYMQTNVGQRQGFVKLAEACGEPFLIVAEEDFEVTHSSNVNEELGRAIKMLNNRVDAVHLRNRLFPGSPNYAHDSFRAGTCCGGPNPGSTHIINHIMWNENAEATFPELRVCDVHPKTWCASSAHAQYTNNPVMYRTKFAAKLFDLVPTDASVKFEPWLTTFWSHQNYTVAWATGMFTHNRIDRAM